MSAEFEVKELKKLFDFKSDKSDKEEDNKIFFVTTDSRNISKNQIFIPLVGEKFDGHDFIDQALEKGAPLSFCEKNKTNKTQEKNRSKLILVSNTLEAYHTVANSYRKKINPKVIAITGSSGKTTVKDLISLVLSKKYKVHKTQLNFNNEFGVPKTILEMNKDTEILVLELAMRGKGQIKQLSKIAESDISIITNVGCAHVGILGDLKTIIEAKAEIFEYTKPKGLAFLPDQKELLDYVREVANQKSLKLELFSKTEAENIKYKEGKTYFTFNGEDYCINALGEIHALNAILAIKVAQCLELSKNKIKEGLLSFEVPSGRGRVINLGGERFLIDESYNANPESVKIAVSSLIECWDKDYKKVVVLGELAELGQYEEKFISNLNKYLASKPISKIITIGKNLKDKITGPNVINVDDNENCCKTLEKLLLSKTIVLVKGSRVAALEKIIKSFNKQEV